MAFLAKDTKAVSNPWLMKHQGEYVWCSNREEAYKFQSEISAVNAGKKTMPESMKDRVVAVPA